MSTKPMVSCDHQKSAMKNTLKRAIRKYQGANTGQSSKNSVARAALAERLRRTEAERHADLVDSVFDETFQRAFNLAIDNAVSAFNETLRHQSEVELKDVGHLISDSDFRHVAGQREAALLRAQDMISGVLEHYALRLYDTSAADIFGVSLARDLQK